MVAKIALLFFLDAEQQRIDHHLQSIEQALKEAQTRYNEIVRLEDKRLKTKAKRSRQSKARKLGNAATIEKAAITLLIELKRSRDDLKLKGTVHYL